jgi:hypothetical protein
MCHQLIADVAKGIAGKMYDKFAGDDEFYKLFPKESLYIAKEYGRYVPEARAVLAKMLGLSTTSNEDKEKIFDALMLDRGLPVGRISGVAPVIRKLINATRH